MASESVTLRIPATLERLEEAREFVGKRGNAFGLPEELRGKLDLVLEELLVNVGSYAYPEGGGDLEVVCTKERDSEDRNDLFCLYLRDWGVQFDPLGKENPDVGEGIDERPVGGLGIFLVTQMADECSYARKDDMNEFRAGFIL